MKRIVVIIFLLIIVLTLSSCRTSNGGKTHVSGDFKYKINKKSHEVMLIGFSEEGKQKETIVLPTMIGGRKVTTIGYMTDYLLDDGVGIWHGDFSDASFKNLYIHSYIKNAELLNEFNLIYSADLTVTKVFLPKVLSCNLMTAKDEYINNFYLPKIAKDGYENTAYYRYNNANVVYYLNDGTNDTFFSDDCDGKKVNVIPPDPYRKGYKFLGWYKEKEAINKFDFENDIIPSKQYDSSENYIFNETSIYAKWGE